MERFAIVIARHEMALLFCTSHIALPGLFHSRLKAFLRTLVENKKTPSEPRTGGFILQKGAKSQIASSFHVVSRLEEEEDVETVVFVPSKVFPIQNRLE